MNTLPHWWQNGVIYQIYPKSFQDTTGSGTGDLRGVTSRLDYLQKLGVDALWITPFYVSPQVANGYDIANYTEIDPSYGTIDDFDTLVAEAHQRGIRIVLDMVLNHTSTHHAWFKESLKKESPYRQFYIWRDGTPDTPPNNWRSKFGGNAWQWDAASGQYYLHLFATEQADLNWENETVRAELKKVCEFWADRGVDGLRLDVINLISKDQSFPDDHQGDGRRFYTDGPRAHEFLQEFSRDVFTPRGLMTVGEMSSTTLENCQQYASLDGKELSMTFNFHHLKVDYPGGEKWTLARPDFVALKSLFNHWQQGMHNRAWNALFWCNHDQPRIVSRFGDEGEHRVTAAKMLAMVLHGMQGTPYIYQGEEIGMTNPHFTTIEQYRDVESHNMYNEGNPWIGVSHNYAEINAERALAEPDSVFYAYQQLIALRKSEPVLTWGDYEDLLPEHPSLWCYRRQWQGQTLLVAANLSGEPQAWEPPTGSTDGEVLMSNYDTPAGMTLRPFEAIWWLQR